MRTSLKPLIFNSANLRIDEFLKAIEIDAIGSRTEEGCLRFDVCRDLSNPNKFIFYEVIFQLKISRPRVSDTLTGLCIGRCD